MLVYDSFNIECSLAYSVVTKGATATGFRIDPRFLSSLIILFVKLIERVLPCCSPRIHSRGLVC